MATITDMAGEILTQGQRVWAENAHHVTPIGCFPAVVIEGHRPAQPGMVWIRQTGTSAMPAVDGGWVTEWPAADLLGR